MNPALPTSRCPQCDAVLPVDAPQGLCPRCLAALHFATETLPPDALPRMTAQPPLSPEELAPHFPQLEILECLGRGGMGVVYKARQIRLNRLVALKLLAPERTEDAAFAARFEKEAQALAALNHPHIVTIHDFGQAGGFYFLIMEYVDGVNLRQALKSGRFLPEQALAVIPPLCAALQYAHEQGIVHRDIKPENLLLDRRGSVKIADFGIAKIIHDPAVESASTLVTQNAVGTPAYAAPEQQADPRRVDHRADIYSLGVVLYELLTGELPGKAFVPPSHRVQVDVRLDEIVLRALETRPEMRFATMAEMGGEIGQMQSSALTSSRLRRGWFSIPNLVKAAALILFGAALAWLAFHEDEKPAASVVQAPEPTREQRAAVLLLPPADPPRIADKEEVTSPTALMNETLPNLLITSYQGTRFNQDLAEMALRSFLNAKNMEERLKWTSSAIKMRPIMERYYATNSDGPMQVKSISHLEALSRKVVFDQHLFMVRGEGWAHSIPVLVLRDSTRWKVDWLAFIEFKDRKLEEFCKKYTEGAAQFHVVLQRQHYFGDDVQDLDSKECFRVGVTWDMHFGKPVFFNKESVLARALSRTLAWGEMLHCVVELEWQKLGSKEWIALKSVPEMNWAGFPKLSKSAYDSFNKGITWEVFPPELLEIIRGPCPPHLTDKSFASLVLKCGELLAERNKLLAEGLGQKHPGIRRVDAQIRTHLELLKAPNADSKAAGTLITRSSLHAMEAQGALMSFLKSESVGQRLNWTYSPEVVRGMMQAYHTVHPVGPYEVKTTEHVPEATPTVDSQCVFYVDCKGWDHAIPIHLIRVAEGWKVDWKQFIEAKDHLLEKFCKQFTPLPMVFYVALRPKALLEEDIPDVATYHGLELSIGGPDKMWDQALAARSQKVCLRKKLAVEVLMEPLLNSKRAQWCMVELEWKQSGLKQWIEVKDVPRLDWHYPTESSELPFVRRNHELNADLIVSDLEMRIHQPCPSHLDEKIHLAIGAKSRELILQRSGLLLSGLGSTHHLVADMDRQLRFLRNALMGE